jgi:2-methylisocitrate lyase-like PEP mutase family enzyme
MTTRPTTRLRELLAAPEILVAPRVHDALSGLSAQACGFQAVQASGHGIAAALLGEPDIGLLTMSESVMVTGYIARALDIPVMADGDTGYGNPLNVWRTVREFEAAGAASVNLEDQVFPKKCGHMDGKAVISREEMESKIQAAVEARRDPDFVIVARTDAVAAIGIDEAIARGNAYAEAGADLIFVEAPTSREMIERIAREIDAPLTINIALGGKTPEIPWEELAELGIARVSVGGSYFIAAQAFMRAHEQLKRTGTLAGTDQIMPRSKFYALLGKPEWDAREQRYVAREELAMRYRMPAE